MKIRLMTILAGIVVAGVSTAAIANGLEVTWSSIDGGGGTTAAGGFVLTGTIGQSDAGTLAGGTLTLEGGFGPGIAGGIECSDKEAMKKPKCKPSGKMKVKLKRAAPTDTFSIELTSGQILEGVIDGKGKGKVKFKNLVAGPGTAVATFGCGAVVAEEYDCP